MSSETRVGVRVRCESCGSEAIVVKAAAAELTCCGAPLSVVTPKGRPPA